MNFFNVSGPWKKLPGVAPNGAGRIFFLLIQALATFWAERIWILRICIVLLFWTPTFWISKSPDFQNLARPRLRLALAELGPGQARLEPSGPTNVDFLL